MNALRGFLGLIILVGLSSACSKKDDATPAVQQPDGKIEVTVGKPIKGTVMCGAPTIFSVVPPADAKATFELRIPKGAPKTCFLLHARDASFKELKPTIAICSDDPEKFASQEAPMGKDVAIFTLDAKDSLQKCVTADFRMTLDPKK